MIRSHHWDVQSARFIDSGSAQEVMILNMNDIRLEFLEDLMDADCRKWRDIDLGMQHREIPFQIS